jgi:hypothetical protein
VTGFDSSHFNLRFRHSAFVRFNHFDLLSACHSLDLRFAGDRLIDVGEMLEVYEPIHSVAYPMRTSQTR